jgi:hypothetical protein
LCTHADPTTIRPPTSWHRAVWRGAISLRLATILANLRRPHGAPRHGVTTGRHNPRQPTETPRRCAPWGDEGKDAPWGDDRAPQSSPTHGDPTALRAMG